MNNLPSLVLLKFERRDIILIAGLVFFMIGLTPFTGLAIAAVVVAMMYFGIKVYVDKRRQSILEDVGDGICMECGSKTIDKKCPNCGYSKG